MAAGDFTWLAQAKLDVVLKRFNLGASGDVLKFALVTSTVTPTEGDALPHFGGTGTTNYATNQCTPGGNYPSGGVTLANQSAALVGVNAKIDFDDVSIAQHASNPTNARWAILYNDTDANKRAIGFLDLGSVRDLTGGAFTFQVNTNGIAVFQ